MSGSQLLFAAADATWRLEAAKLLDCKPTDIEIVLLPEARGEPGTLLRTAFEVRERAYTMWRREQVTSPVSEGCPVIPFPAARA